MSSSSTALADPRASVDGPAPPGVLYSVFAIAFGLSVLAGYLTFLRELPSGDFHAEWSALVLFCLAAASLAPSLPPRFRVNSMLLLLPAVLAALLALQFALGRYGDWQTPAFWIGYLLAGVLALVLGQGIRGAGLAAETANRIAWALVIAGLLNVVAQLIQTVHREFDVAPFVVPLMTCRPYGNIGQSNHAAALAWLAIASTLYLHGTRRMPGPAALPLIALLLLGAALTASRMSWLLLALTCAAIVALPAWPGGGRRDRWMAAGILSAGFAVATFALADILQGLGPKCVSGIDRLAIGSDASVGLRLELWQQAIAVWRTSPWIGVGAYGFGPTVYSIATLQAPTGLDMYAHNVVLQLLAEFGVVGVGAFVLSVAAVVRWLVRERAKLTAADSLLLVLLAAILTHSMLEYPLWYMQFLLPFCLMLGLLIRPDWSRGSPALRLRAPVMAIAGCLLVVAGLVFKDYRALDRLTWIEIFRQQMGVAATPEVRTRITEALADVQLFRVRAEFLAAWSEPIRKDELEQQIARVERLMRREVFAPLIARRIALAILDKDPQGARWHLSRMLGFRLGDPEKLVSPLRHFVELSPEEFASLGPIIDQELARLPKTR